MLALDLRPAPGRCAFTAPGMTPGCRKDSVKRETIQRVATPTAILVGLPDSVAYLAIEALGELGLRVLRVGHVAAASERIPVVMPQLVLVPTTLRPEELEALGDRCVAVGADVVQLAPDTAEGEITGVVKKAANVALIKALRGGRG